MKSIREVLKKLFESEANKKASQPYVHEPWELTPNQQIESEEWAKGPECKELLDWIWKNHMNHIHKIGTVEHAIAFLNTPSANGFVLYLSEMDLDLQEALNFIHLLKEKVRKLGYYIYMSDVMSRSKSSSLETTYRHYLKPRHSLNELNKQKQLFGNITLEVVTRNDKNYVVKFSALTKRDFAFDQAEEINQLYSIILQ